MAKARVELVAPWRWLQQAVALLRRHPRTLALATLLLLLIALLPTLLQLVLLQAMPAQLLAIQAFSFVLSLLVYPPAVGGYFRLLHALDAGREAAAAEVMAPFSDGALMRRLIVLNLLFVSLSLLALSLLSLALDGEALMQFLRAMSALKPGATALPPLPRGALPLLLALSLVGAILESAKGFASAQAALHGTAPLPALFAALAATWRNLGSLLLFYLPLSLLSFLAAMLVALAAVLLGALLGTVLGSTAAAIVVLAAGLLIGLAAFALLFGFFYYGWRELFDEAPTPPPAVHSIAA